MRELFRLLQHLLLGLVVFLAPFGTSFWRGFLLTMKGFLE